MNWAVDPKKGTDHLEDALVLQRGAHHDGDECAPNAAAPDGRVDLVHRRVLIVQEHVGHRIVAVGQVFWMGKWKSTHEF